MEIEKKIIPLFFTIVSFSLCRLFLSISPIVKITIYWIIFINIPAIPCPVDILTIMSIGKKLTNPKNELWHIAFNNPWNNTIIDAIILFVNESLFNDITDKGRIINNIPDNVTCIRHATFSGCTNLETVTIGNSVTSIELDALVENCRRISDNADNLSNVTDVAVESVKINKISIGGGSNQNDNEL